MNNTHQLFFWVDVDTKATYLRRHVPAARAKKTARPPWSGVPWQSEGIQRDLSIFRDMEDRSIVKHIVILFDLRSRLTQNRYFFDLKHSQVRFADIDSDYFRAHHEFCHLIE